jgi:hypothetical protein
MWIIWLSTSRGPKLLFETTKISTQPNSTQQESNYIYLYTTKFGTSIIIWLKRKFETMRVNCIFKSLSIVWFDWLIDLYWICIYNLIWCKNCNLTVNMFNFLTDYTCITWFRAGYAFHKPYYCVATIYYRVAMTY